MNNSLGPQTAADCISHCRDKLGPLDAKLIEFKIGQLLRWAIYDTATETTARYHARTLAILNESTPAEVEP
jgi:hypothetical protein